MEFIHSSSTVLQKKRLTTDSSTHPKSELKFANLQPNQYVGKCKEDLKQHLEAHKTHHIPTHLYTDFLMHHFCDILVIIPNPNAAPTTQQLIDLHKTTTEKWLAAAVKHYGVHNEPTDCEADALKTLGAHGIAQAVTHLLALVHAKSPHHGTSLASHRPPGAPAVTGASATVTNTVTNAGATNTGTNTVPNTATNGVGSS